MLLGRSWIHPAGAVPSTLHQNVKYAIDGLLVILHSEREFAIFRKPLIPHISTGEETEPASYQVFELVSATFAPEGKPVYSQAHLSMARQLKTYGYEPGKGLGRMNQGQIEPVDLPNQRDTRSPGYKKRHGKDRRVDHKTRRSIPHIR